MAKGGQRAQRVSGRVADERGCAAKYLWLITQING
jgi:hypothetical protein